MADSPDLDRVIDGAWGVDTLVEDFRNLVEDAAAEAERDNPRRIRVFVTRDE